MKNIPYGHQWIDSDDIKEVVKVLKSEFLTQGQKVVEFEKKVSQYCNAKYAVAFSSGTAALHAAYLAAGLNQGDEVITTPLTFAATANAALYCGAVPVFADISEDTLNINPKEIVKKISKKTKIIAAVDFAGRPCNYAEIMNIARKHNLLVVQDAAHSLGAKYKGKKIGSVADMTVFSFHPVKLITTGEGGMVVTNNSDFYEKLTILRHHGIKKNPTEGVWYYEINELGYNYRLTDFQSALGISQLKKIAMFLKLRRQIAKKYHDAFDGLENIIVPQYDSESAWHIYPIQVRRNRKKIFEFLQGKNIGVQVHYIPLHLQPLYQKKFGYKQGDFPVAENYYERAITLPIFPKMKDLEIQYVIKTVKQAIKEFM